LENDLATLTAEGTANESELKAVREQLAALLPAVEELRAAQAKRAISSQRQKVHERATRDIQLAIGKIQGRIEAIEALSSEADAALAQRDECMEQKAVWEHLAIAFGVEGIPALKIDAAGPKVSATANSLLEACYGTRFSVQFETQRALKSREGLSEEFDIRVLDAEKPAALMADKSGGERVIIGEALSLGLSLFGSLKRGALLETLCRDECDGALSTENAQRYFDMLRRAADIGHLHRIFFVSHRPEIQEQADAQLLLKNGVFSIA
jgi:DNA repair exonuclease SbcCD ATPase subunit